MMPALLALSDPGGARPVVARWTITSELTLEAAAHFGGGTGDIADMVLIRDARSGGPMLPGTSIAGALRSHLADVLGGYRSEEDSRATRLFGGARGDDLGAQSPLIVFDSFGTLPHAIEIRDGVQIDSSRGIAEEHKKFDMEVLPAGTSFPLRFDLVVARLDDEPELLSLLAAALGGFSAGDIALGARRSRGLGAVGAAKWWTTRHDLSSRDGWLAWILDDGGSPLVQTQEADDVADACGRALGRSPLPGVQDRRRRFVIDADITSTGNLLVRSAPAAPDTPDAAHLQSGGRSVLPGTSAAGALRAQALRIARTVRGEKEDAERWVDRLFGPRMKGVGGEDACELRASKLRIRESIVEGGIRSRPTRVRIDRFTQGVVPGALFDEEPECGGRVHLRLELRDPAPGELGLCLLALKDLLTGEIALGGTSSVGRGRFNGAATLRLEDGRGVDIDLAQPVDPVVDEAIEQIWSAPAHGVDA